MSDPPFRAQCRQIMNITWLLNSIGGLLNLYITLQVDLILLTLVIQVHTIEGQGPGNQLGQTGLVGLSDRS